jgi:hypothetical protein
MLALLALLLAALPLNLIQPEPAAAAPVLKKLTLVSKAGVAWSTADPVASGTAVNTYGHIGCEAIDASGYCTSGIWPKIGGARWIWPTQTVTQDEAVNGTEPVSFHRPFNIPSDAMNMTGKLQVTADDEYDAHFNGVLIGENSDLNSIETYTFTPQIGANEMIITAEKAGHWLAETPIPARPA